MMVWKMFFLFQGCILRFHVNLPGCISEGTLYSKEGHFSDDWIIRFSHHRIHRITRNFFTPPEIAGLNKGLLTIGFPWEKVALISGGGTLGGGWLTSHENLWVRPNAQKKKQIHHVFPTGMSCRYLGSMDYFTPIKVGWIRPINRRNKPTY